MKWAQTRLPPAPPGKSSKEARTKALKTAAPFPFPKVDGKSCGASAAKAPQPLGAPRLRSPSSPRRTSCGLEGGGRAAPNSRGKRRGRTPASAPAITPLHSPPRPPSTGSGAGTSAAAFSNPKRSSRHALTRRGADRHPTSRASAEHAGRHADAQTRRAPPPSPPPEGLQVPRRGGASRSLRRRCRLPATFDGGASANGRARGAAVQK